MQSKFIEINEEMRREMGEEKRKERMGKENVTVRLTQV